MRNFLILLVSFLHVAAVHGQSKDERKQNRIKSVTEWETVYENGKPVSWKSVYEEFDRNGRQVTKIEYDRSGVVRTRITCKYDGSGNKTEETEFDAAGKILRKTTFTYNQKKLKSGKQTIGKADKPESGKKWEYEYY